MLSIYQKVPGGRTEWLLSFASGIVRHNGTFHAGQSIGTACSQPLLRHSLICRMEKVNGPDKAVPDDRDRAFRWVDSYEGRSVNVVAG